MAKNVIGWISACSKRVTDWWKKREQGRHTFVVSLSEWHTLVSDTEARMAKLHIAEDLQAGEEVG